MEKRLRTENSYSAIVVVRCIYSFIPTISRKPLMIGPRILKGVFLNEAIFFEFQLSSNQISIHINNLSK
jgi:hypothetical protein